MTTWNPGNMHDDYSRNKYEIVEKSRKTFHYIYFTSAFKTFILEYIL